MSNGNYGFHFESAGRSGTQGAISPAEQFFEGSMAEESLMRETGQNSIDARSGDGPVTIVFELADMLTDDIPGIQGLRQHIASVEEQTRDSQGHESMLLAHQTVQEATISVLRVGDYGTKGLGGTESINDSRSPLSALTRGAGISADDGARGGSFGIGSAVGPMASAMNTVLYTSQPLGSTEVIFAGYSCLATHRDAEGTWRTGEGFFTDLDYEEDFRYLRNPGQIGAFAPRSEPGTDLYVLGYRKAETDPDLQHIKIAAMRNFLLAIERGELIVIGKTPTTTWRLDSESLQTHVVEDDESAAFYRAIKDPNPVTGKVPNLGEVTLYINVDDTLKKSLHTVSVRKPHMKIHTFKHTSIPIKYAAVLECSEDQANKLLRKLEPPQHHKWDPERAVGGKKLLTSLSNFVRKGLKSRVKEQIGEQVQVEGLSKYLPDELFEDRSLGSNGSSGFPAGGDGTEAESSRVRGREVAEQPLANKQRNTVRVKVRTSAADDGDSPIEKGKDAGGDGKRAAKGGSLPGAGGGGSGTSRISAGDLRFRSWSDAESGDLCLALTPIRDITGDLELVPLGPGGSIEDDYVLPIAGGTVTTMGVVEELSYKDNVLAQIELKAGVTTQVRLRLSSNHRYRLGIK